MGIIYRYEWRKQKSYVACVLKKNKMWNQNNLQVKIMQEGPVDATERGSPDERQMTSADSLYGAVRRAQTVTIQAMAAVPSRVPATHSLTIHPVLFVICLLSIAWIYRPELSIRSIISIEDRIRSIVV